MWKLELARLEYRILSDNGVVQPKKVAFVGSVINKMEEIFLENLIDPQIDDDHTLKELTVFAFNTQVLSLQYLCAVLHNCNYKVKSASSAVEVIEILRTNKHGIDIVLVDVDTADLNAFKVMETIGLETNLPVIMVTADSNLENITKGLAHGAVDCIIKPFEMEQIKNTIQSHVASNKTRGQYLNPLPVSNARMAVKDACCSSKLKKKRLAWSRELDAKFVKAVQILEKGSENVHPKRILDVMNEPGVTRAHISSHLQKYRLALKKRKADTNKQGLEVEPTNYCLKKREVGNFNADRRRLAVQSFNGVMSPSSSSPDPKKQSQSLVYSCIDGHGPEFQTPDFYYNNHCLETNIQPHNVESEHVSGTTTLSPYFNGVDSKPSILSSAAVYPFPNAVFLEPEANIAFHSHFDAISVPNPLYGFTIDCSTDVQYPSSTVFARNSETHAVQNGTTLSTSDTSSYHYVKPENEVSETYNSQIECSLFEEESFDWYSLLDDQYLSSLT
ncbi:hypothetical protein E1A91_D05G006300v1 [Gossypium mustelinum]|uniref:Response regulatory domain-containing protein n=1 Tax=Gossypium mustelinum TaxID=34275 RepID=A0A5D2UQT5_GOSMU|nr:hypothetical protein E1A91_D05G006300v1 [Gossypium mustelinum]